MKYIVSTEWLANHYKEKNVRVVDCRFFLDDVSKGVTQYAMEHISNAAYFHLEWDLSSEVTKHGGRHPLPNLKKFVNKLNSIGVDNETIVVAYDDGSCMVASRFWWLLRFLGHTQVYVLEGGMKEWRNGGYPTDMIVPLFQKKSFLPNIQIHMIAAMKDVKQAIKNKKIQLLDSREYARYTGEIEPIDKKAGHIPRAMHCFWKDGLTEDGKWKSIEEQQKRFANLKKKKPIIVYCGSGVSATPNVLALLEAGFYDVKLYVGSFSDWISYDKNKIETC